MISNNTTSLDTKSSYTSREKSVEASSSRVAQADDVADDSQVIKEEPVAAKEKAAAQEVKPSGDRQQQLEEVKRKVTETIPRVRELMQKNQRSLDFEVAEQENRIVVTVIDKETDQVIRQIPPEDVIHLAEAIDQGIEPNLAGIIFNTRA